jgi:hypothetical protein
MTVPPPWPQRASVPANALTERVGQLGHAGAVDAPHPDITVQIGTEI